MAGIGPGRRPPSVEQSPRCRCSSGWRHCRGPHHRLHDDPSHGGPACDPKASISTTSSERRLTAAKPPRRHQKRSEAGSGKPTLVAPVSARPGHAGSSGPVVEAHAPFLERWLSGLESRCRVSRYRRRRKNKWPAVPARPAYPRQPFGRTRSADSCLGAVKSAPTAQPVSLKLVGASYDVHMPASDAADERLSKEQSSSIRAAWDSRATGAVIADGWASLRRDAVWLMVATRMLHRPFDTRRVHRLALF